MSFDKPRAVDMNARPLVVSVMSGKGGVGKTVISYNLAEQIASRGHRALVVDTDSVAGNLHLLSNVAVERGLDQYLRHELNLGQAVTTLRPNLGLLARSGYGPIDALTAPSGADQLVGRLRTEGASYGIIIIDHNSGISSSAAAMAQVSDICLLVVVPELTSIADAYGLYKYLMSQNKELDCRLLVNRAPSAGDAEYLIERFGLMASKFLGSAPKLLGWLSEHPAVADSVNQQRPIAQVDQKSIVCQQVGELAGRLINDRRHIRPLDVKPVMAHSGGHLTSPSTINNTAITADIKG